MLSQCARFIRRLCFTRRALTVACFLLVAAGVALFYSNWLIVNASQHLTWNDIQTVPARNVGLVLGAKPGNRYFTRRINTAAALYHAGKVKWLLVSGDNGKKEYDEPSAMQQALIAKGVPEAAIFCDYAGFSTLDSVVRARKVFGESRITIISQAFHNQRAIWLAQQYGIDAIGVNAPDLNKSTEPTHDFGKSWRGLAQCWMPKFCIVSLNIWALASLLGLIAHTGALLASKMPECVAAHWQGQKGVLH